MYRNIIYTQKIVSFFFLAQPILFCRGSFIHEGRLALYPPEVFPKVCIYHSQRNPWWWKYCENVDGILPSEIFRVTLSLETWRFHWNEIEILWKKSTRPKKITNGEKAFFFFKIFTNWKWNIAILVWRSSLYELKITKSLFCKIGASLQTLVFFGNWEVHVNDFCKIWIFLKTLMSPKIL